MQPDENLANAIHPQLIASEGIEELSTSELIQASQSRALKTVGVSPARLREQMNTWIQLHYREGVSGVLLCSVVHMDLTGISVAKAQSLMLRFGGVWKLC